MKNESDIRAFRRMNGAKPAVMGRMDVALFKTSPFARQTAGPQSRKSAQMLYFRQNIALVHKLRQRISGEKFFDSSLQRFGRNKLERLIDIGVNGGHPVLNISFHLGQTDPNFLLKHFTDVTNASRTQMVNIILGCSRRNI